jgi:hypothetical protein
MEGKSNTIFSFCILSFGWFPGAWILDADVSENTACPIFFIGGVPTQSMKMEECVPKRRNKNSTNSWRDNVF